MNQPHTFNDLLAECVAWNDANPTGCTVLVEMESGDIRETTTRSPAGVLSGHSAVIWLTGFRGCYLLSRVTRKADA